MQFERVCVGASAERVRDLHYHKYCRIPPHATRCQPRSAHVSGPSQKEGECSFLISGNVASFLPASVVGNIPLL